MALRASQGVRPSTVMLNPAPGGISRKSGAALTLTLARLWFFRQAGAPVLSRATRIIKNLKPSCSRRHGGIFLWQGGTGQPVFTGLLVRQSIFLQTQREPVPAGPGYSEKF